MLLQVSTSVWNMLKELFLLSGAPSSPQLPSVLPYVQHGGTGQGQPEGVGFKILCSHCPARGCCGSMSGVGSVGLLVHIIMHTRFPCTIPTWTAPPASPGGLCACFCCLLLHQPRTNLRGKKFVRPFTSNRLNALTLSWSAGTARMGSKRRLLPMRV